MTKPKEVENLTAYQVLYNALANESRLATSDLVIRIVANLLKHGYKISKG